MRSGPERRGGRAGSTDEGPDSVRVLLVDDQLDVAETTALHLERRRDAFEVLVETGGPAALDRLESSAVDCIVSDYEMPSMDGLALLREVSSRDESVPFILFTGKGSEEIASEAISTGVTDYLQKRATADQYDVLANRIEHAVARRRSERAHAETELRYRHLVDTSPDGILVHRDGEMLYANQTLYEFAGIDDPATGYEIDPLSYVHPDDRERVRERLETRPRATGENGWLSWRLQRPDGEVRYVESRGAPIEFAGRPATQVVVRDVTAHREHERRLESLNAATRDLFLLDSREAVADRALAVVEEILDEPIASVWAYDPSTESLVTIAATDGALDLIAADTGIDVAPDAAFDTIREMAFPSDSLEMRVFREGEPRVFEDYGDRDDAVVESIRSAFLFPLESHGMLGVASTAGTDFEGWKRDLLDVLCRSLVAALDRLYE
ncbi:response regulator [Haloarcula salina]|uniref:response regulator n=1 Tax=Haloarcula salina TaxID=1429914 RepID=UPI003C6F77A4